MVFELAQLLQTTVDGEFRRLSAMTEEAAAAKADGKWSRKQELGHLIDSASNNHLRFVRAALEPQYQGPIRSERMRGVAWLSKSSLVRLIGILATL